MIALYRTQSLLPNEKKWLKSLFDAKLGMTLGVDVLCTDTVTEALSQRFCVCLGADSRAVLLNYNIESDMACRGRIEEFGQTVVITTWNVAEAMRSPDLTRELLLDAFSARVYAYGLGNKNTGHLSQVKMSGPDGNPDVFNIDSFENVIAAFDAGLRGA